ncbi:hypothetical protein [Kineobactrum salinum]|uniref:Uncharacterized protein n=1 Tax=Kineobactrum salinum TaxID=2708301 RepID=A0A6C0U4Y4_9GAMM|nr:hypothetical protein [Kineobactrum salinum]QIB67171.1 hypothetical protein G3T16_18945 [Kineobactrum salinum]
MISNGMFTASNDLMERITAGTNQIGTDGRPPVRYDANDPEATLASVSRRQRENYEEDYIPVEDRALASLRDMSIINDAKERVGKDNSVGIGKARSSREAARYGFRQTKAEKETQNVGMALNKAAGSADNVNNARLNQFDRNVGFRNEMINIGRGVMSAGNEGMAEAANLKSNRDNANRQAAAGAKAQNTQMLASMAMMAAVMM